MRWHLFLLVSSPSGYVLSRSLFHFSLADGTLPSPVGVAARFTGFDTSGARERFHNS